MQGVSRGKMAAAARFRGLCLAAGLLQALAGPAAAQLQGQQQRGRYAGDYYAPGGGYDPNRFGNTFIHGGRRYGHLDPFHLQPTQPPYERTDNRVSVRRARGIAGRRAAGVGRRGLDASLGVTLCFCRGRGVSQSLALSFALLLLPAGAATDPVALAGLILAVAGR